MMLLSPGSSKEETLKQKGNKTKEIFIKNYKLIYVVHNSTYLGKSMPQLLEEINNTPIMKMLNTYKQIYLLLESRTSG